jgi:predicted dehydrogenase
MRSLPEVADVICVDPAVLPEGTSTVGTRVLPSLETALPYIDAAVIATPPTTHAALALEAIGAGKHVLVEKPMATSIHDARRLVSAADEAGVVLMVGHTYTYDATVQKLRSLIRSGDLGELHYLDSSRLNLGLYRRDVSVVWDLAVHDISIMDFLLDSVPDTVEARSEHCANGAFDDTAYIWLEYRTPNVGAAVHVSWLHPRKVRQLTVVGSQRMAVYDDVAGDERLKIYDKGVDFEYGHSESSLPHNELSLSYRYGDVVSPFVRSTEPLLAEDRDFIECILTGRQPLADARSGLAVVETLTAVDESIRRSQIIDVDELRAKRVAA